MQHNITAPEARTSLPRHIFFILILLASLAHVVAELYIPSLPAIADSFAVKPEDAQLTLTFYLVGFSLSQLFYGPLSDRVGRRIPILIGLSLTIAGSMICLFSHSIPMLILGRFIQGAGVGSSNSVTRSLSRDLLSGSHLARLGSHIGMVSAFVMAITPTFGGYVQHYLNWHTNFLILLIYTGMIFIFVWKTLPETNQYLNPEATHLRVMLRNYWIVLTHRNFVGFTICAGVAYAGLVSYLTVGPFLLQSVVGLTPVQFGWLAFCVAGAIFFSAIINSQFVVQKGVYFMISCGIYCMIAAGLLMLIPALFGYINTWVIMAPVALFAVGSGLTFSNAFAGAFHSFAKMSGIAGALYGCLQILYGALSTAVMAETNDTNQIPLAVLFLSLGMFAWVCVMFVVKKAEIV